MKDTPEVLTGQVAEDYARVLAGLSWGKIPDGSYITGDESRAALSRLVAKAHGYEATTTERDAYRDSLIEAARFEMDWAFQDGNSPGYNNRKAQNYGRQANEFRLRAEKAEQERDVAVASNAALLEELRDARERLAVQAENIRWYQEQATDHARALKRARNEGLEKAAALMLKLLHVNPTTKEGLASLRGRIIALKVPES